MQLISKYTLHVLIIVILYLLITGNLLSGSPFVLAGQLFAIIITIWARRSFKNGQFSIHAQPVKRPLLLIGPYQFIRHPMYASALLFVWSGILGHLSIINTIIGFLITSIIIVRIVVEEQFLQATYPNYTDYSFKTKRLIPFII